MKLIKNYQYLKLFGILCFIYSQSLLFAQGEINITFAPTEITSPIISGIGGTELVTIELSNESKNLIELPEKRWLVIEREDKPGIPYFTPMAPYSPLILHPKEKLKVVWRLRQATNVHFASGTTAKSSNVAAGLHNIVVYYKCLGENVWRTHVQPVELHKISTLWIVLGVIVAIVLFVVFFL